MFKLEISQNVVNPNKQSSNKTRLRDWKEIHFEDNKSRDSKQNDSKHMNAIRPYVTKQRKNSKRQGRPVCSSSQISRSKSKKLESSSRKIQQNSMISCQNICLTNPSQTSSSKQINEIYQQMMVLKTEYKSLKNSYNNLMKEKQQATCRQESQKQNYHKQKLIILQELQKSKKNNVFLESQIERIKRECFKILECEKFKYKKLEQTLQQKQLMIAYLRKEIDNIKKGKEFNNSSQDNLDKIFFLQNSAPIFSYESYARLSANNSTISAIGNVLIEQQTPQHEPNQNKASMRHRKSQLEQDSLSFSRDNMRQFESVHSLLTNNNDQTILTFTKKDIVVLDDSLSLDDQDKDSSQKQQCPTFQNRKDEGKQIISFQNLKSKKMLYKSESRGQSKKAKNSRQQTKRLQILTDDFKDEEKHKQEDQNSCETKKKFSKSKIKNTKKSSKSEGLHSSMLNQALHGSFIKKESQSSHVKNQHSKRK